MGVSGDPLRHNSTCLLQGKDERKRDCQENET